MKDDLAMTEKKPSLRQLVTFCILMEQGKGIISKSPDYIREKFHLTTMCPEKFLLSLLDPNNQAKYCEYIEKWAIEEY